MEGYGVKLSLTLRGSSHIFSISMDTSVYYCFLPRTDFGIGMGIDNFGEIV